MGTTTYVHLHGDETIRVEHVTENEWPRIVVEGQFGTPIADVTLLFDHEVQAALVAGLLDSDGVQASLTPDQLSLLAIIVRYKAPQFVLAAAGLFKADAAETITDNMHGRQVPDSLRCDHCHERARWQERGDNEPLYAVHDTGAVLCDYEAPQGPVCTIDGKRFTLTDEDGIPVDDESRTADAQTWPVCPECSHDARYHRLPSDSSLGCTVGGMIDSDKMCGCLRIANYTTHTFDVGLVEEEADQ